MKKRKLSMVFLALCMAAILFSSCNTCKSTYRRQLSDNEKLKEANESYEKAIKWLDKAECSAIPHEAAKNYTTAESYISDTIYKLKTIGHDENIDVTEDIYYCDKIKSESDVKIGQANKAAQH